MKAAALLVLVALSALAVLAGCLSPQHADALRGLEQLRASGAALTPEQYEMLRAALLASGGFDWLVQGVTALVGGITGMLAVRVHRGPAALPEERRRRRQARRNEKAARRDT